LSRISGSSTRNVTAGEMVSPRLIAWRMSPGCHPDRKRHHVCMRKTALDIPSHPEHAESGLRHRRVQAG
jgi:hypothetical protein